MNQPTDPAGRDVAAPRPPSDGTPRLPSAGTPDPAPSPGKAAAGAAVREGARRTVAPRARSAARLVAEAVRAAERRTRPDRAPAPPLRGWRRRLRWAPALLAYGMAAVLVPTGWQVLATAYGLHGAPAGILALAQAAPLVWAFSRPLRSWWIVFPADLVCAASTVSAPGDATIAMWPFPPAAVLGYLFLMVALGLRQRRATLIAVWVATGVAGWGASLLAPRRADTSWVLVTVLSGILLLVCGALREFGDNRRRLREQETISEAERARRTLLEERARIARELHDVVAHHMSVITVQADSAPYRLDGLTDEAREEFASLADSARRSLTEMRRLLGVLRNAESERTGGPAKAPQPGLSDLPALVAGAVRAGVPVRLHLAGEPVAAPAAVDLSAYRIVQEALANVVLHAPGSRTVVSVGADEAGSTLTVLVVNSPPTRAVTPLETAGTGHGLVGMRERVRLLDGMLDTGPLPDGGFRVAARLPLS